MAGVAGAAADSVNVLAIEFPAPLTPNTFIGNEVTPYSTPAKSIVMVLVVVKIASKAVGVITGTSTVPVFTN